MADAVPEEPTVLELTEDGFSASPESLDDGFESPTERCDPSRPCPTNAVDRFLGEAAETEQSRDLEPVGAPF